MRTALPDTYGISFENSDCINVKEIKMCECYRIGGRFIAEDADCQEHGREAQERAIEQENDTRDALRYRRLRYLHDQGTTGWHVRGADLQPISVGGLDRAIDDIPPH